MMCHRPLELRSSQVSDNAKVLVHEGRVEMRSHHAATLGLEFRK